MSGESAVADVAAPRPSPVARKLLKPAVFVLCLVPLLVLLARTLAAIYPQFRTDLIGHLSANPIESIIRYLGDWALRFILIALAVTPLRRLTGWTVIGRLRRMLGLFAFTYVALHMLVWLGVDQVFDLPAIWREILKRKFITVGMAAFLMLLPLAITSTDAMVRRLGGRAWRRLHKLVFPAAIAGVIHYFMMIKAGLQQPAIYAAILAALILVRLMPART